MKLEFSDEASECFSNLLSEIEGFTVEVRPLAGEKYDLPFDAIVIGADVDTGWYDGVCVRAWNEDTGEPEGEPFTLRVESLLVY